MVQSQYLHFRILEFPLNEWQGLSCVVRHEMELTIRIRKTFTKFSNKKSGVCRTAPAIARSLLSYRHHKLQARSGWQGTLCTASGEWHGSMHLNALGPAFFAISCTSMTPSHHCTTFIHLSDRANEVLMAARVG